MVVLDSMAAVLAITGTFLLAGLVKGVIGIGLPTVSMGLLGVVLPPAQAASLIVAPAVITNVWQAFAGPSFLRLMRRLWTMLAGICIGTWIGVGFLAGGSVERGRLALGVLLLVYGCTGFTTIRFHVPPRAEPWLSPAVGIATGMLNGATGIPMLPALPYVQAMGLNKDNLVQALAFSPLVCALALGASLAANGVLNPYLASASLMAVLPALVGMYLGQRVRSRISEEFFRRTFFFGTGALGLYLVARNLTL